MKQQLPLLLLHGALGSKKQLEPLITKLTNLFDVYSFDFSGHSGKPISESFSIDLFSKDLSQFLDDNNLNNVGIFGYSMGGYVALNQAYLDQRIVKIFTLGTKFGWSPAAAAHEVKMLNPDKIEEKIPAFAKTLEERHTPQDWKKVMKNTADMMLALGNKPTLTDDKLTSIKIPIIVGLGSEDTMVTEEESRYATTLLPKAKFKLFQDFKHPIEQVDIDVLARELVSFFSEED